MSPKLRFSILTLGEIFQHALRVWPNMLEINKKYTISLIDLQMVKQLRVITDSQEKPARYVTIYLAQSAVFMLNYLTDTAKHTKLSKTKLKKSEWD